MSTDTGKEECARLVVVQYQDGTIRVEGSIGDQVKAYGLLALARDAIFEHHLQLRSKAKGNGFINLAKRFNKGAL